jgi:hypothetical protein
MNLWIKQGVTAVAGLTALLSASLVVAQAAPEPIRGNVASVTAEQIVVRTGAGPRTIALAPDWAVQVTKAITVADIKEGSFVGTTNMPKGEGQGRSLEVHVFPPGVKVGEGHYSWNLRKGSMMTNGTVGKVTANGRNGRELEISYPNGARKVVVPPNVPVVQIVGGSRDQIKPGVPVFLVAFPKPGGSGLITGGIAIGENGKKPPM